MPGVTSGYRLVGGGAEGGCRRCAGALRGEDGGGGGSCDMQLLPQAQRSFRLAQDAGRLLFRLTLACSAPCLLRLLWFCSCIRPMLLPIKNKAESHSTAQRTA